jgi:hypothetical protein
VNGAVDPGIRFLMAHGAVEPNQAPDGMVIQSWWQGTKILERQLPDRRDREAAAAQGQRDKVALQTAGLALHEVLLLAFCGDCGRLMFVERWE